MSLSGTVLFGFIFIMRYFFRNQGMKYCYLIYKYTMLLYLIPALVFALANILEERNVEVIDIDTPDFSHIYVLKPLRQSIALERMIPLILTIWLVFFILLYIVPLFKSICTMKKIIREAYQPADSSLLCMKNRLEQELNLRLSVPIFQSKEAETLFITGFLHPKIVVPQKEIKNEDFEMMLRHELIHFRNRDVFFKFLANLIIRLNWFNPLIWIFLKYFFDLEEFICDSEVVASFDLVERKKYASLLVRNASSEAPPSSVAFSQNNYQFVKRRIIYIMKYQNRKSVTALGLTILIFLSAPFTTYAATVGSVSLQGKLIQKYENSTSIELASTEFKELQSYDMAEDYISLGSLITRGTNSVDCTLSSGTEYRYDTYYLAKGNTISISLASGSTKDSYCAGIISSSGKKTYVNSSKGVIAHTFTISKDGNYTVFFQNKNTSGSIHLLGGIIAE